MGFDLGIDNSRFGKTKKKTFKNKEKKLKTVERKKVESMELNSADLVLSKTSDDKVVSIENSGIDSDLKPQPVREFKNSVSELDINSSSVSKKSNSSTSSIQKVEISRKQKNAEVKKNAIQ